MSGRFCLTVLGSGTSQGVPLIGKEYPSGYLENPKNHRMRSSIHVETDEVSLVVDTAPEFRLQILRENIRWLDAVIFTHSHADHVMGLDDCRRFCWMKGQRPMPIYASEKTLRDLKRVYQYAFNDGRIIRGYFIPEPHLIDGPFELGDLRIYSFELPHGSMSSLGFVFEQQGCRRLAYFNDCKEVTPEATEAARGTQVAMLDGLRPQEHPTHMALDEALTAARRIAADRTLLTHLTDYYDHDRDEAELPANVRFAYDGLKIELS